jgi:hypothetical protein
MASSEGIDADEASFPYSMNEERLESDSVLDKISIMDGEESGALLSRTNTLSAEDLQTLDVRSRIEKSAFKWCWDKEAF